MGRRDVEAIYPLAPTQQGMLFETLCAPGSGINIEQWSCTLEGPLDVAAFEAAWRRVLARHAMLRTGFVWKEQDEPLQVVLREVDLPFEVHDWRSLGASEQRDRLAL